MSPLLRGPRPARRRRRGPRLRHPGGWAHEGVHAAEDPAAAEYIEDPSQAPVDDTGSPDALSTIDEENLRTIADQLGSRTCTARPQARRRISSRASTPSRSRPTAGARSPRSVRSSGRSLWSRPGSSGSRPGSPVGPPPAGWGARMSDGLPRSSPAPMGQCGQPGRPDAPGPTGPAQQGPAGPGWAGPATIRPGAPYPRPTRSGRLRSPQAAALRSRRLRRRALMLLLPVPLLIAAIVFGIKLAFLPVLASYASDRYDTGEYTSAAGTFGLQKTMNVVDPWKAWFNAGTASHSSGDDYSAIDDLHAAYDLAEGEEPMVRCRIQINLSISYETSGDYEKITGDDYLAQKKALEEALASREAGEDYDEYIIDPYGDGNEVTPKQVQDDATTWFSFAERSYATAEQVRGWPGCEDQSEEEKEQNEASVQRLQDKQQQAKDAQPLPPQEPQEGEEESEQPELDQSEEERAEAERQDKLQQQNSDAKDDEEESRRSTRSTSGRRPGGDGRGRRGRVHQELVSPGVRPAPHRSSRASRGPPGCRSARSSRPGPRRPAPRSTDRTGR
ncbi:hypothetical protein NKG05_15305 [Oerskovia sp. M15]